MFLTGEMNANGLGNKQANDDTANFFVLRKLVRDTMLLDLEGEWTDAVLFVPYQTEQVLFCDYPECIASRYFFKMAGLPFQLDQRPNAEFMSPTGKVPFLKLQKNLIADFASIVEFVGKKGIRLSSTLTDAEKADLQAYISLIDEILLNAELYFSWKDSEIYSSVTKGRYASGFLWPLSLWMPMLKRSEILTRLKRNGWASKSAEEVLKQCNKCFQALSAKLGKNTYFFGDQPTELDALAFGHLYTIFTTQLPDTRMAEILKNYSNLSSFCRMINNDFFN